MPGQAYAVFVRAPHAHAKINRIDIQAARAMPGVLAVLTGADYIADGPKFFEELMAAVGSRDGREVVRELETLRGNRGIERDGEGRYVLQPK